MLSVADEIFLLMLDDRGGGLHPALPLPSVHNAIAGALLMDLSLHDRIDTDLKRLFVVDATPLGEPTLDQVLSLIIDDDGNRPTHFWLNVLAVDGSFLQAQMAKRLTGRDGVADRNRGQRQVGGRHGATARAGPAPRDVKRRIARVVLRGGIPAPRDVMVISLATACSLWSVLIYESLYSLHAAKIEQLAKMDLIGREVTRIIRAEHA